MLKPKRTLKANRLNSISPRYLEDTELQDIPARLYRKLLHDMDMNPYKWTQYLRNYLEWTVPDTDPEKARVDRATRTGNIKDTYFHKPTLTFNKFLEGLSILRMRSCEVTIKTTDQDGNVYVVTDTHNITSQKRPLVDVKEPDTK